MTAFFTFSFANFTRSFPASFLLKSEIYSQTSGKAVRIDHQVSFNILHIYTQLKKATQLAQIFSLEKYV